LSLSAAASLPSGVVSLRLSLSLCQRFPHFVALQSSSFELFSIPDFAHLISPDCIMSRRGDRGDRTGSDRDTSCKVYVGNLGNHADKYELEDSFSKYGPVKSVWVARNPPGFAFVEFEDARYGFLHSSCSYFLAV
jgi:hypothetical protein